MASHSVSAARRAPSTHESAAYIHVIIPTRLLLYSSVVLRRILCRICPSRRLLRQFNFELMRSQQPTDRVDLVERSAQLSFRAWRYERRQGRRT